MPERSVTEWSTSTAGLLSFRYAMRKMRSRFAAILCIGAKECSAEWRANKADNQSKGITERAYVTQCRAGTPDPSSAAAPTAAQGAASSPPRSAAVSPAGANQFAGEDQAKTHCPADTVVWVNLSSKVYHYAGTRITAPRKRVPTCVRRTPRLRVTELQRLRSTPRRQSGL